MENILNLFNIYRYIYSYVFKKNYYFTYIFFHPQISYMDITHKFFIHKFLIHYIYNVSSSNFYSHISYPQFSHPQNPQIFHLEIPHHRIHPKASHPQISYYPDFSDNIFLIYKLLKKYIYNILIRKFSYIDFLFRNF